jgi:hypothetical protein
MKKWTILLLVGVIALTIVVVPASAKTIRTPVEGQEVCGDLNDIVFDPFDLHARDGWMVCTDTFDDDRLTGEALVMVNWNFKFFNYHPYGPMWGTVHLENQDGYWEGSWVGEITKLEGDSYINSILRGHGAYEGLQARLLYFKESTSSSYVISGFIMNPGGNK